MFYTNQHFEKTENVFLTLVTLVSLMEYLWSTTWHGVVDIFTKCLKQVYLG